MFERFYQAGGGENPKEFYKRVCDRCNYKTEDLIWNEDGECVCRECAFEDVVEYIKCNFDFDELADKLGINYKDYDPNDDKEEM